MKRIQRYWPKKLRHPWPNRLFHWLLAPAYLVLLYTGIYISRPGVLPFMHTHRARQWHFVSLFIFLGSLAARIYYGMATKNYREIIPGKRDLAMLPAYLKYEFFLSKKEPVFPKYNPLQKLYYTAWVPLFILQGITGAILYAPRRLASLEALLGGLNRVRKWHYLLMLLTGSNVILHLYLATTSGWERFKSIFTGYTRLGKK